MYSVIIPVYRNADTLQLLLERLNVMAAQLAPEQLEVIFTIDGSPDDSADILRRRLPETNFSAQLIAHSRNFGSFAAIRTGLAAAKGEYFAVMAADLQEPPELVMNFFRQLKDNQCDIAVGVRAAREDGFLSTLASRLFWGLYRKLAQPEMPRGGVDMFGCNDKVRRTLLEFTESHSTLVGLLIWAGFRRQTVSYQRLPRPSGSSGWSLRRKIQYMEDSFYAFSDLPIRLLTWGGGLGIILTVILSLIVLVARFVGEIQVPGYTPIILAVMFFGALNLMCLGLIGGYVWRNFENSKRRPHALTLAHDHYPGRKAS